MLISKNIDLLLWYYENDTEYVKMIDLNIIEIGVWIETMSGGEWVSHYEYRYDQYYKVWFKNQWPEILEYMKEENYKNLSFDEIIKSTEDLFNLDLTHWEKEFIYHECLEGE